MGLWCINCPLLGTKPFFLGSICSTHVERRGRGRRPRGRCTRFHRRRGGRGNGGRPTGRCQWRGCSTQQHLHRLLLTPPTLAAAQRRLAPPPPTIAGQPSLAIGCRVEVLAGAGRWQQRRIPSGLSLPGGVRSLHTRRRCERPLELRTRSVWKLLAAVGQQRLRADWPGVEIAAGLWFVSVSPYEVSILILPQTCHFVKFHQVALVSPCWT
jgi:hypothetical protein